MVGLNKLPISTLIFLTFFTCCSINTAQAVVSVRHKKARNSHIAATKSHKATYVRTHHKGSTHLHVSAAHNVHHHVPHITHQAAKPRYAYPANIFLMEPPAFDSAPLAEDINTQIRKSFYAGNAGEYPTRSLVRASIVSYYPMRGGIFFRREPIKYLIMHSTEPGVPVGAKTIIDGWSHMGRRHAGAHYVIDRDGTIYQAVDPDLATVHVNIFKTLPGINNDNSIGIEMCHQGRQDYPPALVESACRLAAYLQSHYHISDANVITHRYAQQGDHTDPVNFAWDNFISQKDSIQNQGINQNLVMLKSQISRWESIVEQPTIIVKEEKPKAKKHTQSKVNETTSASSTVVKTTITQPNTSPFEAKFGSLSKSTETTNTLTKSTTQASVKDDLKTPVYSTEPNKNIPVYSTNSTQPEPAANAGTTDVKPNNGLPPSNMLTNTNSTSTPVASPRRSPATLPATSALPNSTDRLMPLPGTNRLVPTRRTINVTNPATGANLSTTPLPTYIQSQQNNQTINSAVTPTTAPQSRKILPLRGPIEMDPAEIAPLEQ